MVVFTVALTARPRRRHRRRPRQAHGRGRRGDRGRGRPRGLRRLPEGGRSPMAASEELARRIAGAGRSCSLTGAVLEGRSRPGTPKQAGCLAGCLEAGDASRESPKRATLLRRCALPAPKTFDGHGWSAVPWPEGMGREDLLSLGFLGRREGLVLMGNVGAGKTRMASALCAPARERRLEARFFTAPALVSRLRGPRLGQARPGGRADRPRPPARHRRARVPAAGRRRRQAGLPGLRRRLRGPVGGDHDGPRVRQVGLGLRRRPDGGRRHRPHSPPRQARPVPRRVLPRASRPDAGGAGAQIARAEGAHAAQFPMTILLKSC